MLKVAWNEHYTIDLPEGHRFPMIKYDLVPEQLLYEGTISQANIFSPQAIAEENLLQIHESAYWQKLKDGKLSGDEIRKMGFPYSQALVERELVILQGTIDCALFAREYGVAMNVAGGTHHAFSDRGEGFCLLNDIAVAACYLLQNALARQVLVVDLDVHQGNGTAHIFRNESRVFTFSIHGGKNYPLKKEASDLDIDLPDGIGDADYLHLLQSHLPRLIDQIEPDFIFYQSGVDVLATDKLGRLGLSIAGCKNRDRFVLEICKAHSIPVAVVMGGGYSARISDIVEAHANTFRLANEIYF
ncbi:MAG: histone deacetylase [Cyclobacteriaceae bacterium]|nr:histone deacetylase [Cyclobacteriaceae bacterium]